tara:strand:- start:559 stop:777 length:219 start_codon:yes stop_codon:yes gene_type:complete
MQEFDDIKSVIAEKEKELIELKTKYKEQRTAGLKAAMEARRSADEMVRTELKALGYSDRIYSDFNPINLRWF